MCGRFTITAPIEDIMIQNYVDKNTNINYKPIYNAAQYSMFLRLFKGRMETGWESCAGGSYHPVAKDDKIGSKMINALAETITEKPSFNSLLASRRCIIPADGFFY